MMNIYEVMIYCIKSEINKFSVECDIHLSESEIDQLYKISNHHDLSHIVGDALIKNKILDFQTEFYGLFKKKIMLAIYRYEKTNYDFEHITKLFEKEHIRYVPLKGVILREFYPARWMRTSCDIDILIEKENFERATRCLLDAGLKKGDESQHDITFITASGSHIELHHSLIEEECISDIDRVLGAVWEKTTIHEGYSYWYDMSDEMFYFYHIAHMAKHFLFGGCGVKPFMDLWILDNFNDTDHSKRDLLLKQGNLLTFTDAVRKLSKIWFENKEYDSVSRQMEDYILQGGVYGNAENRIIVQQQKNGGRFKYALSKIFLPYGEIKYHYPILQKHRWMTPVMEVYRWCKLIFCGHLRRSTRELIYNNNVTNTEAQNVQNFLNNIGL